MRYLNFSTEKSARFAQFVEHVLSQRNHLVHVFSIKFTFRGLPTQAFVETILNYASSHNVQHLSVTCTSHHHNFVFPLSLFSSQSLKHLILTGTDTRMIFIKLKSKWDLPALTTLYLSNFNLYEENSEIFSNCPNLKNLTLKNCTKIKRGWLDIYHSQLLNLTLENICNDVYVEAPQLKTLTVSISLGYCSLEFSGDVPFLEKVDMSFEHARGSHTDKIFCLLQQFRSVKFLTLNLEVVELLSSSAKVVSHRSPFSNLEGLWIYPINEHVDGSSETNVNVYSSVKNYFLDNSPNVTLTMVLREEIRVREVLQWMLMQWEADTQKRRIVKHQSVYKETRWQLQFRESYKSYWKDFCKWFQKEDPKTTYCTIPMLRVIEQLLQKLPTLQRDKMQSMYATLCPDLTLS